MIEKFEFSSLKVKLKEILVQSDDSIVDVRGGAVDNEVIGEKSMNFHKPIGIERDSFSDFTGW